MSLIGDYEKALSLHISREIKYTKVKLWAEAFSSDSSVPQRSMLFLGHQKTERSQGYISPISDELIYWKRYTIELRAELYTLKNHQECLDLIEYVLDDVLAGFKPFLEFTAFTPETSGEAQRDKSKNIWVYSATGVTSILSNVCKLTPIFSLDNSVPKIVEVGLYNNQNNSLIGTLPRE